MNMTFAAQLRKMITAGLGGDVEAPETGVAVGRTTVYTDLEAAPVQTFETNAELPITNLKVWMEPIQDLHGQDAPYPAGGGKNQYNADGLMAYSNSGITITVSNGQMTFNGTATSKAYFSLGNMGLPTGNYVLSVNNSTVNSNVHFSFRKYGGEYFGDKALNSINQTITITNTDINSVIIYVVIDTSLTDFVIKPQLETGITATAWSPYSNICPISGRDEVNVYVSPTTDKEDGRTYEIPLGSTVYGGSLDVTTGALTVTRANIASYDGETINEPWISSMDAYTEGGTPTTGAQVVYPLSEPEIVQLDPIEVKALIGTNNVFSDSGDVSLTYGTVRYTEGY